MGNKFHLVTSKEKRYSLFSGLPGETPAKKSCQLSKYFLKGKEMS